MHWEGGGSAVYNIQEEWNKYWEWGGLVARKRLWSIRKENEREGNQLKGLEHLE